MRRSPIPGAALRTGVALAALLLLPGSAATTPDLDRLKREVDAALDQGSYARADWGVLVVSLDRGDTLFARSPSVPLSPASNMKVLTSAAALHYLGPDYRFTTWLLSDGPIRDGVLEGDLILYGTGDPGISDRFFPTRSTVFEALAAELQAAGIHRIQGSVIGDGSRYTGDLRSLEWEVGDLNEWFAAPSGALSYNENVVSLRIAPGLVGGPPEIGSIPDHTGLPTMNEARTVGSGSRSPLAIVRDDPEEPVRVVGDIRAGSRDVWRQMTITDPALFAAHGLTHVLRDAGVEVMGAPKSSSEAGVAPSSHGPLVAGRAPTPVLAIHQSPPLSRYLEAVNQRSHNLYADLILKTLGFELFGEGSFEAGERAVLQYLEEIGAPTEDIRVLDGSGLAPGNRVTPGSLVSVLTSVAQSPGWDAFWESLPEAGASTMNRRMSRTRAAGNLRAKTGTISRVSSLSGFVRTADGEQLAFAIIGNRLPSQYGAKRLEDRVGEALASYRR